MKVANLKKGMWLEPKPPYRWNVIFGVRTLSVHRGSLSGMPASPSRYAIYLGQRCDLGICEPIGWSNRYCLFEGQILPVDQSDWPFIQPAK